MELKDVTCTWQEWGGGGGALNKRGKKNTPFVVENLVSKC